MFYHRFNTMYWLILGLFHLSILPSFGQCSLPTYAVTISNSTSNVTWTSSGGTLTGGTRNKVVQINSSPSIFMRITYTARSSTSVAVPDWDNSSGGYGPSWQPNVTVPSSTSDTDTSWAEFFIEFASSNGTGSSSFDNNKLIIPCLAMTIIDCDGSGNATGTNAFREIVQVAAPSSPLGIVGSTISSGMVGPWVTNVSGVAQFNNIDTIFKSAMVQMNFESVSEFHMRVGTIGRRSSSTTRQNSFWFRPFDTMTASLLPVLLQHFSLTPLEHAIKLNWTTTFEVNAASFDVEKSKDGLIWNTFAQVPAVGFSSHEINYEALDYAPFVGRSFYRLKQWDWDGSASISPLLTADFGSSSLFDVFPNPFSNQLNISGPHFNQLRLRSNLGKVFSVYSESSLTNEISWDVSNVPSGFYFLEILQNGTLVHVEKLYKW